jgi:hypothetical protein
LSDTHPDYAHGAPKAFLSRFIVLQAIGAAGIAGLWVVGIAGKPFAGNNAFLCWFIAAIGVLGIVASSSALARCRLAGHPCGAHRAARNRGRPHRRLPAARAGGWPTPTQSGR